MGNPGARSFVFLPLSIPYFLGPLMLMKLMVMENGRRRLSEKGGGVEMSLTKKKEMGTQNYIVRFQ